MGTWVQILITHIKSQVWQFEPMVPVLETGSSLELTGLPVWPTSEHQDPWEVLSQKWRRRVQSWAVSLPKLTLFPLPTHNSPSFPWQLSNSTYWASPSTPGTTSPVRVGPSYTFLNFRGVETEQAPGYGPLPTVFPYIVSIECCFSKGVCMY